MIVIKIFLAGKPVMLDLENLKDDELCMRDANDGSFETETGEQHFSHYNALPAAEKHGKRLLTNEENYFISQLPWRWDNEHKGRWITFDLVEGGTKDIFFKAAGYRGYCNGTLLLEGAYGYYWSASPYSSNNASYLAFYYDGDLYVGNNDIRAYGFSVRCVKDFE